MDAVSATEGAFSMQLSAPNSSADSVLTAPLPAGGPVPNAAANPGEAPLMFESLLPGQPPVVAGPTSAAVPTPATGKPVPEVWCGVMAPVALTPLAKSAIIPWNELHSDPDSTAGPMSEEGQADAQPSTDGKSVTAGITAIEAGPTAPASGQPEFPALPVALVSRPGGSAPVAIARSRPGPTKLSALPSAEPVSVPEAEESAVAPLPLAAPAAVPAGARVVPPAINKPSGSSASLAPRDGKLAGEPADTASTQPVTPATKASSAAPSGAKPPGSCAKRCVGSENNLGTANVTVDLTASLQASSAVAGASAPAPIGTNPPSNSSSASEILASRSSFTRGAPATAGVAPRVNRVLPSTDSVPAILEDAVAGPAESFVPLPSGPIPPPGRPFEPVPSPIPKTGEATADLEIAAPVRGAQVASGPGFSLAPAVGDSMAKFAGGAASPVATTNLAVEPEDKKVLTIISKHVTGHASELGIYNALPTSTMTSTTFHAPPPAIAAPVHGAAFVAEAPASPAPAAMVADLGPVAHRAVDAVLTAAELLGSGNRSMVHLQFAVGDARLSVQVEMRAGEVRATFRTDSGDLRAALATEWQAMSGDSHRAGRLADAVFAPAHASSSASYSGDGASQQKNPGQRPDAETFQRFDLRPKPAVPAEPKVVGFQPAVPGPKLNLHTFA